ncbi:hypothetical protein C8R47DRAFT_1145245, partial [Mycena vitilis]
IRYSTRWNSRRPLGLLWSSACPRICPQISIAENIHPFTDRRRVMSSCHVVAAAHSSPEDNPLHQRHNILAVNLGINHLPVQESTPPVFSEHGLLGDRLDTYRVACSGTTWSKPSTVQRKATLHRGRNVFTRRPDEWSLNLRNGQIGGFSEGEPSPSIPNARFLGVNE